MNYALELLDATGLRRARIPFVPLLEVTLNGVDGEDSLRGLLPADLPTCDLGWTLRLSLDGTAVLEAQVTRLAPQWGDTKKLIVDRYVSFHAVLEVEAETRKALLNESVSHVAVNQPVDRIVRELINRAPGTLHYTVQHDAYPDGAVREYEKFLARASTENALETGGIAAGQWVDAARIDATGAYAKEGDTLAGLVVDGVAWPDVRLMMINCEETSRNARAIQRHPEVSDWSDARYARSGYCHRGLAAKQFLQDLLDTRGISHIELNPHRDAAGEFDDRIDAQGRYLGLVYGGGECFNAALIELGHAAVCLHEGGRFLDPALALKEFFSYPETTQESIGPLPATLAQFSADAPVFGLLATLAYAAGGAVLALSAKGRVRLRIASDPDRVLFFDTARHAAALGEDDATLATVLSLSGNPLQWNGALTQSREESRAVYGDRVRHLAHFAFGTAADLEQLAQGLLDDVAYPASAGTVTIFRGDAAARPGELIELREAPLRRLFPQLPQEHGNRYPGRIVARVHAVRHRIFGQQVETQLILGPPLRSVQDPLEFMVRGQRSESSLYAFALDDANAGLDLGLHLD